MTTRRIATIAAATIALAGVAAACDDGPDEFAASDEIDADTGDRDDELGDDEAIVPDNTEEFTDGDLIDAIESMGDDEFEEFVDELTDAEYERLLVLLEGDEFDGARDATDNDPDDAAPDGGEQVGQDADGAESASSRDDVDCSADGLGDDDTVSFTTAHVVVDGQLGDVCFGAVDDRLVAAWDALAVIAPQGQLADLGLFGGFEQRGDGDDVTLAFVNALDDDRTLFQMSVNLDEAEADPPEAQLTMAHEFTHVFASLPSQVEYTVEAIDDCQTYYNGEGCYTDDSIMWQWIQRFWGDGLIDQVDPEGFATAESGQARCDADPGFFGAYAASTPEEDFAESFSVYVLGVETFTDEQDERIAWIDAQPGLAEYRERADAAGVLAPPNNFDECGLG